MGTDPTIDRLRLDLERQRIEIDKEKAKIDARLINKHFGAIITGTISAAAVIISLSQFGVSYLDNQAERMRQQELADREWRIEAANFVLSHMNELFSEDRRERTIARRVVDIAFPEEIAGNINVDLTAEVTRIDLSELIRNYWKPDGETIDPEHAEIIHAWLSENGIDAAASELIYEERFAEVRDDIVIDLGLYAIQHVLANVPNDAVDIIERNLTSTGAAIVNRVRQEDGLWTIHYYYISVTR